MTPSRVTQAEAARLLGTSKSNISAYRSGALVPGAKVRERLRLLDNLTASGVAQLRGRSTMPSLAVTVRAALRSGEPPHRWVAEWIGDYRALTDACARRLSISEPSTTGSRGYDALLAGVAEQEALQRGDPAPGWTGQPRRLLKSYWLAGLPDGLFAYALAHTRPALKARGVLLPDEELMSV